MTQIIALTGPAGSGKDITAAKMMSQIEHRNPDAQIRILSFADPIKAAVAMILDCDVSDFEQRTFKESNLSESHDLLASPRQMMQLLGDEWGRQLIDPEIWIKLALNKLNEFKQDSIDFVFITDLRYDNEQQFVLNNGGSVIGIDREAAAPISEHASEAGLSRPACYKINNNGSLNDLCLQSLEIVKILQPVVVPRSLNDVTPAEWDRAASNA
ncbi:hypothetical protein N2382_09250 [SAR92 clade bacterium H921]|nr:hypothetical protein [SAR92 clade bacterium H921]